MRVNSPSCEACDDSFDEIADTVAGRVVFALAGDFAMGGFLDGGAIIPGLM